MAWREGSKEARRNTINTYISREEGCISGEEGCICGEEGCICEEERCISEEERYQSRDEDITVKLLELRM